MATTVNPKDKWIPWYFVLFFVGLAIVDGVLVTIATSTHRGVVTQQAYDKGLHYNDIIAAADMQEKLGWTSALRYEQGMLMVLVKDAEKHSIEGAEVTVHLARVTQDGYDFSVVLKQQGDGYYGDDVAFPLPGLWRATTEVAWNGQHYQMTERLLVK